MQDFNTNICENIQEPEEFKKLSFEINNQIPNWNAPWDDQLKTQGIVYSINANINLERALEQKNLSLRESQVTHYFQLHPFAKGTYNYAYYCKDEQNLKLVMKRSKYQQQYQDKISEIQKSGLCYLIAQNFNKDLEQIGLKNLKIYMISTFLVKTEDQGYYTFEGLIKGKYEKITNNWSYINRQIDTRVYTAFSHYSWHKTKGRYLVVDLQGVGNFLTDPAMHSINCQFSNCGDMGQKGINMYFMMHQCNELCNKLNLSKHTIQNIFQHLIYEEQQCQQSIEEKYSNIQQIAKCKNRYCNTAIQIEKEWCDDCQKLFNEHEYNKYKVLCSKCACTFEINKFQYYALVQEEPNICEDCK